MNLGQRSKYPQRQRSHGPVNKLLHLLSNNVLKTGQLVTNAGIRLTALVLVKSDYTVSKKWLVQHVLNRKKDIVTKIRNELDY